VTAVKGPGLLPSFPLDGSGPRARGFVTLLLRLALGLSLFNEGLMGFLIQRLGKSAHGPGVPSYLRPGAFPGAEEYFPFMPYLQMGVGLALVLGLLTTYAALAGGLILLLEPLIQTISLVSAGLERSGEPGFLSPGINGGLSVGGVWGLQLAAAVIWLVSTGGNLWSLDTLIFHRRRKVDVIDPNVEAAAIARDWAFGPTEHSPRPAHEPPSPELAERARIDTFITNLDERRIGKVESTQRPPPEPQPLRTPQRPAPDLPRSEPPPVKAPDRPPPEPASIESFITNLDRRLSQVESAGWTSGEPQAERPAPGIANIDEVIADLDRRLSQAEASAPTPPESPPVKPPDRPPADPSMIESFMTGFDRLGGGS
jgi:uncharacterized membrane protein YphA (DoxX/SURF4 family)